MTALENVLVGMHIKLRSNLVDAVVSTPPPAREEEARPGARRSCWRSSACAGRDDVTARNLPYGDQRRLEIARALASEPVLLLLDEPTAGMNPNETEEMKRLIAKLRSRAGADDPAHRARHARGHGRERPDHRARPRRVHRRGHAGRGARAIHG